MRNLTGVLLALWTVVGVGAPAAAQVTVETFSSTFDYAVNLPGTAVGGGIQFSANMTYSSLD